MHRPVRRVSEGVRRGQRRPAPGSAGDRGGEGGPEHAVGQLPEQSRGRRREGLTDVQHVVAEVEQHERAADGDREPVPTSEDEGPAQPRSRREVADGQERQHRHDQQGFHVEEQSDRHGTAGHHQPEHPVAAQVPDPGADGEEERELHGQLVQARGPPHQGRHRHRRGQVQPQRRQDRPADPEQGGEHPQGRHAREQLQGQCQADREPPVQAARLGHQPGEQAAARHQVAVPGGQQVPQAEVVGLGVEQQAVVVEVEPAGEQRPGPEGQLGYHHQRSGADDQTSGVAALGRVHDQPPPTRRHLPHIASSARNYATGVRP